MGKFICFFSLVSCPSLMFAAGNSTLKEYHVKVTLFCTSDSLLTFCVILNLDRCLNACSVTHLATVSDLSKHSGGWRTVQLENASHRRAQKVTEFVEMVQMETTIEFGKHKRDPREKDVLNLYKYINENCLQCTFPCDPAKVVLVSAEPDRKRCGYTCMATNLEHPLLFRYIVVFGVNNENYEELYHTLVHEIVHVLTRQLHGPWHLHDKKFKQTWHDFVNKLNVLAKQLPHPFSGMMLDSSSIQ